LKGCLTILQNSFNSWFDESFSAQTIHLKTLRKIKLPGAIFEATRRCYNLELISRNTIDFSFMNGLTTVDPFNASCLK